ncbi:unnamed protein product, partial [Polarella glacialis]
LEYRTWLGTNACFIHKESRRTVSVVFSVFNHGFVIVSFLIAVFLPNPVGNIASREQMRAMSQLVTKRAARALHRRKAAENQRRIARPLQANRMRILGGGSPLNLTERHWRLPGARFLGVVLVGFRSEHFLPDAQSAVPVTPKSQQFV